MNIIEEFERLKALMATDEGWKEIDEAWMVASNYEKRGGDWYKREASAGDLVAGFAIDIETKKFVLGAHGQDHDWAFFKLIERMKKEDGIKDFDAAKARIVKGHHAIVDGWESGFLNIFGGWNPKYEEIEAFILSEGIGLPTRGLFQSKMEQVD